MCKCGPNMCIKANVQSGILDKNFQTLLFGNCPLNFSLDVIFYTSKVIIYRNGRILTTNGVSQTRNDKCCRKNICMNP